MKRSFSETAHFFLAKIVHKNSLYISLLLFLISSVFSFLHYKNVFYGNSISWIGWIASIITFLYAFLPQHISIKKSTLLIFIFMAVLYFASHLLNFSHSPWNINGLFDDAAWDIYFAKNHIFNGTPFQAAFFDNVGYISREVIFHYYISIFFKLFGYNLLVFNTSLLILGFITILFTTLIVQGLFNKPLLTLISAAIINFFPLHFTHIFVGHRYAISAPLMTVSLFFLYTAFLKKSYLRAGVSAIFASLCLGSAIMGKQYIYGLILGAICLLVSQKGLWKSKEKITIGITWIVGFITSSSPLIIYILFNSSNYLVRENNLLKEFINQYQFGGIGRLKSYFNLIGEVFFAKFTYRRWFLPDFYLIPLSYYLLIIPGLLLAIWKRRFEIAFLAIIPVTAAFLSGAYDFRILIAVPMWVICMSFSLNWLFERRQKLIILTSIICLIFGLFSSIKYLWNVSINPNYFWLLPHRDVAVSRLIQDITAGSKNPTSKMKWDEFNRKVDTSTVGYDTFAAPVSAYAIMHLYLQNYDDKKILTFIDQGNQLLATPKQILNFNISAIKNYSPTNKDLKLVWEISDRSSHAIDFFSHYNKYGKGEVISDSVDGNQFSLYVLTINNKYIDKFKNEI